MADPRINLYLSQAGLGSRRACEEYVRAGRVQIDGEVVTELSQRGTPGQTVRVDGRVVHASSRTVVFALNKPERVLSSTTDPDGRALAIDIVRPSFSGRLFSIGRLDFMSTGLLLFTNDGDLAQALMRPAHRVEREYLVESKRPIPDEVLQQFRRGITLEGITYRAVHFTRKSARRVAIFLAEGKNRELRTVFAHFHLPVKRIHRVRYGPIRLGELPSGSVRRLNDREVQQLRSEAQKDERR